MIFTVYLEIWVPASILQQGKEDRVVYILLFQKIKLFIFAPMWTSFWGSFLQNHILVLFNFLSGNEYNLTSNLLFKYRGHHIRSGEGQYGRSKTFRAVNGTSRNFTMHGEGTVTLLHQGPFTFPLKDLCWESFLIRWVDIKFGYLSSKFTIDRWPLFSLLKPNQVSSLAKFHEVLLTALVYMGDGTLLHKSNATKIQKKHF